MKIGHFEEKIILIHGEFPVWGGSVIGKCQQYHGLPQIAFQGRATASTLRALLLLSFVCIFTFSRGFKITQLISESGFELLELLLGEIVHYLIHRLDLGLGLGLEQIILLSM